MPIPVVAAPLVWLGDLPLAVTDDQGVDWIVGDIAGWSGSPAGTLQVEQRTADHGGWGGGSWLTPRKLKVTGTIISSSDSLLVAAVDQLSAAASLDATELRVVESGGLDRTITVRRDGEAVADIVHGYAKFEVPLVAADPRRYGPLVGPLSTSLPSTSGGLTLPASPPWTIGATVVQGTVRLANAGTIASRPTLRINGPVQQPQVLVIAADGTTSSLTYWADLASGEYLDVDCDAHTVLLGGTVSRRGLMSGTWPEVPAGSSIDIGFRAAAPSAGASLAVSYRSAWM
jgi:hypothetical protein